MIITIDKNTLRVVGVKGAVGSAMKKELLHTSVDLVDFEDTLTSNTTQSKKVELNIGGKVIKPTELDDFKAVLTTSAYEVMKEVIEEMLPDTQKDNLVSPLVFEDWLINQKVNTRIFWKNCKIKHGGIYSKRQTLAKKDCDDWIYVSFNWSTSILDLSYDVLKDLSAKWKISVKEAKKANRKIEFGFGVKPQKVT